MARNRKARRTEQASKAMRKARRAEYVAALADGRVTRPATFVDRKKEADRRACRDF